MLDGLTIEWEDAAVPAGPQVIETRLGGSIVGDLDLRVCHDCRCAVLEHLRVDPRYRQHGLARVALAEVAGELDGYAWSTTSIEPAAAAFWAHQRALPVESTGQARYCRHMLEAESQLGCE